MACSPEGSVDNAGRLRKNKEPESRMSYPIEKKFVVAVSSTVLFDKNDPLSPSNRRINIVVLNKRSEEAMLHEDGSATLDVDRETGVDELLAPTKPVAGN